ncbi:hypothetical protein EJ110_NYTH34360 [Nymphaea thermarum]|nr:hypothetical protein EJ110_NYTH34360 [Nymphaea thermarum]
MKVLKLVDSKQRPSIGYLYESMDIAKENTRDNLKEKKKEVIYAYIKYYRSKVISFYFTKDRDVEYDILVCIDVLVNDHIERDAIHLEIYKYYICFIPQFDVGQPCIQVFET